MPAFPKSNQSPNNRLRLRATTRRGTAFRRATRRPLLSSQRAIFRGSRARFRADGIGSDGERQHERERRVIESESAIALIPVRGAFVLGVDQQRDAADIMRDADARSAARSSSAPPRLRPCTVRSTARRPSGTRHVLRAKPFSRALASAHSRSRPGSACRSRRCAPACRSARRRNISRRRFRGSDARIFADRY